MNEHFNLILRMKTAGYQTGGGICHGTSYMAMQAFLLNKTDLLIKRITKIISIPLDTFVKLQNQAIPQELVDLYALMDMIELAHRPQKYREIFDPTHKPKNQNETYLVRDYFYSTEMKDRGGLIASNFKFILPYNKHQLRIYLSKLTEIFKQAKLRTALFLSDPKHAITIGYDPALDSWFFFDINQMPVDFIKDINILTQKIFTAFDSKHMVVISSQFYCLWQDRDIQSKCMESLEAAIKGNSFELNQLTTPIKTDLFLMAANENEPKIIKELLNLNQNVDSINEEGETALYFAAQNGHTEIVELLLLNNANVNLSDKDGYTALYVAASEGQAEIVDLLLKNHANVNLGNKDGYTALYAATVKGHTEIVRLLLNKQAKVDIRDMDGNTALYIAALKGDTKIVELLLDNDANVNLRNKDGHTALYVAARYGHTEIVKLLLKKQAQVDLTTTNGDTPLNAAVKNSNTEIVTLLKENSANTVTEPKTSSIPNTSTPQKSSQFCIFKQPTAADTPKNKKDPDQNEKPPDCMCPLQ